MASVLPWPATVFRTHERQCSSDSRSARQMNLDPQPHTYHPGPFQSPQRSAWLKHPWRCVFYNELCMEVYILDEFWILIQVVWPFLNRRAPCGPPFCQKSAPAVVRAVVGCNTAARRTKYDRSYSFHTRHLRPLRSQATLCGGALSWSTKFVPICCSLACGCGCRVCLRRP